MSGTQTVTAFAGERLLASGPLAEVAAAVRERAGEVLIFDDADGRPVDVDFRGSPAEVAARLAPPPRGPGRPKLGVAAREVTLLPRHWDWLAAQPGGASVALRKLVEAASRSPQARRRAAQDAAYRFMSAMAGNAAGFEEAVRALYAADGARFAAQTQGWPADVRRQASRMAAPAFEAP